MKQVLKNCGNFSSQVLKGMIAYGEEKEQGRGKLGAQDADFPRDGYVTKEGDMTLGGFLFIRAAQEAAAADKKLSAMTVAEKQKLAYKIARQHMAKHGPAGPEYYRHWMERVEKFAGHHGLTLPGKGSQESSYEYFRRLRAWTETRSENWPKLRQAVGTHLVLSPEPRLWETLRGAGIEERTFLKRILAETMKDFADWRRQIHGPGRGVGWVAGTHAADENERHPHIHLIILKRDEDGREVDMSGALKNRKGREKEPDPLETLKARFTKNVEREFERSTGLKPEQVEQKQRARIGQEPHGSERVFSPSPTRSRPSAARLTRLSRGLKAASMVMRPYFSGVSAGGDLGAMLRIIGAIQRLRRPSATPRLSVRYFRQQVREMLTRDADRSHQPGE